MAIVSNPYRAGAAGFEIGDSGSAYEDLIELFDQEGPVDAWRYVREIQISYLVGVRNDATHFTDYGIEKLHGAFRQRAGFLSDCFF